MSKGSFVVAIDGPAGAGKSTLAKNVAKKLGMRYLDTGALYRALAYHLHSKNIPPEEGGEMEKALGEISLTVEQDSLLVNGEDVRELIRTPLVDSIVSSYASLPSLRRRLLSIQREQGERGELVADGRDMGTVVFPDADVKVFLTASDEVRAKRRQLELTERGESASYEEVLDSIRSRDRIDSERSVAPLRKAEGAVVLDTDGLTIIEAVDALASIVLESKRRASSR
ncbi:MAG: (d)CMP kinase [Synergistaceae bacterium]|nr:(d)CMP kinase [Synergistota bacterium]NLM70931.1 (d)CMP kinase [Synergistaceae bacterium]